MYASGAKKSEFFFVYLDRFSKYLKYLRNSYFLYFTFPRDSNDYVHGESFRVINHCSNYDKLVDLNPISDSKQYDEYNIFSSAW